MAGFFAAARFVGRAVAAGGSGTADCHKGLRNVGVSGVKLQTAVADNVVCLEHQGVFDVGVVDKLPHGRKERFHVLVDTVTDTGRVNADTRTEAGLSMNPPPGGGMSGASNPW